MEHLTPDQFADHADHMLAHDQALEANAHLASCAACRAEFESYQQLTVALAGYAWVAPPDTLNIALLDAFHRQTIVFAAPASPWATFTKRLRGLTLRRKIRWVPALALSLLLVVAAALFLLTMPPFGASAASASSVSGHVEMQSAGATAWSLLHSGTALQSGDVLSTGEDGSLLVAYPDGSTTTLQPNTLMALNELRSRSRTVALDLRSGETANYVASAGLRRALFEITTPSAVVSSYAANFRVGVDQFGATYAVVDSGEIAISAAGSVLNLRAGQQAYVPADQPPHLLSPDPSPTPVPSPTIAPSTTAQPTVPADSPPSSPQPTIEPLPPPAVVPPGPPGDRPPREDRPGHDAGNDDDDRGDDDEDNHGDSGDNEDDDD